MRTAILLIACAAFSGCTTLRTAMENEPACSLDRTKGWAQLGFGPVALALKFTEPSARLMCGERVMVITVPEPQKPALAPARLRGYDSIE